MAVTPAYDIRIMRLCDVIAESARGTCRPLAPAEVVIALAQPEESCCPARESMLMALLSDDERVRLARFRFEQDGRLFLLSHAMLRMTLSLCTGVEPRVWQFRAGKYGRPEIVEPASRLRFNISHTRGLAACAAVLNSDIGLDVEDTSRGTPIHVMESFFSSSEAQELQRSPCGVRVRRFFTYWTLKEAYVKALGIGLSLSPGRFSMYEDAERIWRITFHRPLRDDPRRWWFWSSQVSDDHQAALALSIDRTPAGS
jgi:4'-phosphopantetheinyl transferase